MLIPFTRSQERFSAYFVEYERLMEHWRRVLPIRMMEVDYEDLVTDQERVSREMISFCGLEWDERCLEFHKNERPIRTGSSVQVRQPMFSSSVGRWRHYEQFLDSLKESLGISANP